ncbi:MAG TPA: hypothetical protein VLK84_07310 [Longimicrobium sp.]|nr:hypothetical protein [Longimicrobium sp.]
MRLRVFPALVPILLAACAPAAAPPAAPAPADVPPVLALLDARERLALSGDQVVQLESIARDWEAANDTLARRIGAVKGRGANPLRLAVAPHARTARAAIAENNRRAARAVERALQPEQRQRLCTVHRLKHQAEYAVRAAKTGQARGGEAHPRRRGDSPPPWPWCADSSSAEARSAT